MPVHINRLSGFNDLRYAVVLAGLVGTVLSVRSTLSCRLRV